MRDRELGFAKTDGPEVRHPSLTARDEDVNLKGPATSEEVSQLPSSLKL
jgi:hypothetical protein